MVLAKILRWSFLLMPLLSACGQNLGTSDLPPFFGEKEASVSWSANREKDVNTTGGGYRVYYWDQPSFSLAIAPFVDVPYVAGLQAPTSSRIKKIAAGKYYIKVVAYSAFNPQGTAGGNQSASSSEISIMVP